MRRAAPLGATPRAEAVAGLLGRTDLPRSGGPGGAVPQPIPEVLRALVRAAAS